MTEKTPTTQRIKDSYVWFRDEVTADAARAEFDRWLEEHDRKVAAIVYEKSSLRSCGCLGLNPYCKTFEEELKAYESAMKIIEKNSASGDLKLGQCCAHCKDPHCYGCECDEDNE